MSILSNTPTIRYITIQNLVIKDSNVYYPIATTETSRKYIYWDKDSPYELICEDEMLEDRANLYLLVINKKGNFTIVNQDSISVNFDENIKLDGFNNKLNATVEKVDEHTKKFMSVTEDINGINKTVGTITEDLNETNENLTNYKQTADQIAIDLQNTNKKYNDDKEFNKLRESIVSLLIDENTLLMGLNSSIKDITRDNSFTEEEKTKVKETQSKITNKNDLLIIEVDKLVSMLEKEGLTDKKNQLTSVKEEYSNSFSLLNSTLTSLISGNLITPTQITTLINCISNVSTKLTKLKNICDEIIFLGTGGTLYEEIAKINITAGGIYSKISSIEENIKSNLSLEKGILNQHVKDLQTTVDKIETIIKEIYIDGLVNQNEKDLVSQNLQSIENEHNDLIGKYNEYLSNKYLSQEMKVKLQGIYSDYVSSYDAFVNELNTVISDGFFNESEKTNVDLKLEDYRKNIIILHNNLSLAIDDYEQNRYKSEIEAQKNQLQGEINKVQQDLSNLTENVEGTFKDNVIDESERNSIKQNIKNLNIQKANIDSQYSQLYKNPLLVDPLKSQFTKVYTNFNSSYDTLLVTLNEILNKDTLITQQDKINMDRCYADLVLKTTEYTTIVNQVVEFIANAEAEQSKASFQDEIDDLQRQIDGIDLSIDGTFADNILDKTERELIKSKLKTINANKIDIDSQYNKLYNSPDLTNSNLKVQFKEKYDAFIAGYNKFTSIGDTLLKKEGIITEEEKKKLNDAISSVNTLLGEFTTCSLNVTESIYNTQTQNKISDINGDINDLTNRMDNVVTTVGNALTDGILDKAEKTSIEQGLLNLQAQKIEIDNEYNQLYTNINLDTQSKSQLKKSYDTFILKYNTLINSINVMLTKEDLITDIERNNYTTAYEDYKSYLAIFTQSLYEANSKIYNKITENAKGELSKEIGKVSQSVSDLSGLMNGAFYDGVLSEAEKIALKSNLDLLKIEKVDVDNQYKQTYNNSNLGSSNKSNLKTAYDNYIVAYNALVKFIETLIASVDKVNASHKTQLDTLLKAHNDKLALYVIQYNLAIENISKSYTDTAKNILQQQIEGVSNSISDLEKDMNGVFQDGVLSEAEKLAIKERLQSLQVEKVNIDNQYNSLNTNVDLIDKDSTSTPKTNLKNAYNNLVTSYTKLVNAINTFLNTQGILDETHRKPVSDAFADYKNKLGVYSTRVNEAIDAISKKRVEDEANTRKEQYSEVNRTVSEISTKVASVEKTANATGNKVANLETWKKQAEVKITDASIINAVSSQFYKKGETDSKYATQSAVSTLTQTVNSFEFKFTNTQIYNEIRNSSFVNSFEFWSKSKDNSTLELWRGNNLQHGTCACLKISVDTAFNQWCTLKSETVDCKPSTYYSIGGRFGSELYPYGQNLEGSTENLKVLFYDSKASFISSHTVFEHGVKGWNIVTSGFTTPPNASMMTIERCGIVGGYGLQPGTTLRVLTDYVFIKQGTSATWAQHETEVYNDITRIDDLGVKVQHEQGSYSRFNSKEFHQSNENGDRTISMRNGGLRTYQFNIDGTIASAFLGGISSTRNHGSDRVYGNSIFGSSSCGYVDIGFSESGEDNQHQNIMPWLRCTHYDGNTGVLHGIHAYKNLYVRNWSHFYYRPQMYYGMDFPYENRGDLNVEKSYISTSGNASPGTRRLYINGADGVQLLVQNSGDKIGHQILEEGSQVGLYHQAWGNWDFNGWSLNNARVTYSLSNPIAKLSSKERRFTRESEAIMSTFKLIQDRGEDTTMDGQCIVEIPDDIKYNIGRYDVNIIKYGRGDIWVSERTFDYFVVESDNDIKFTWVLEGELLEGVYRAVNNNHVMNFSESTGDHSHEDAAVESIPASKYTILNDEQIKHEMLLRDLKENNQLWKLYKIDK